MSLNARSTPNTDDATLKFYTSPVKQNPESHWSHRQKSAAAKLFPDYVADPANAIDINGKPVFDCTFNHKYEVTENEMSDFQKIAWKQYLLYKTTLKVDRRDTVYEALATSDTTNSSNLHNWLGAPFPVIEPKPSPGELFYTIRWYEHISALACSLGFYAYLRAKPSIRFSAAYIGAQRGAFYWTFGMLEFGLGHRASCRLRGTIENEREADIFGVVENKSRLEEKVKFWEKYRAYKEEWMKRYDYYVYGLRPGERFTLLSSCHFPPAPVLFNKRTDFKLRRNPFLLSEQPATPAEIDKLYKHFARTQGNRTPHPLELHRPEVKYYGAEGAVLGARGGMMT